MHLAYWGTGRPESYGIQARWIPVHIALPREAEEERMPPLRGGIYCVSASALQALGPPFHGPCSASYEQEYGYA